VSEVRVNGIWFSNLSPPSSSQNGKTVLLKYVSDFPSTHLSNTFTPSQNFSSKDPITGEKYQFLSFHCTKRGTLSDL